MKDNLQKKAKSSNKCNIIFFVVKEPFKKDDVLKRLFARPWPFDCNLPLQFVESVWFKNLILHLFPRIVFLSRKQFFQEILLNLAEKMKQVYVLPKLTNCIFTITSFDSWISKGEHDIFALVINFLGFSSQPKQITISLFEAIGTTGQALTNNFTKLFDQYGLKIKTIAYVKDEGSNLNTMTSILKFVVKCEVLGLDENFQGACFGHVFFQSMSICDY